MSTPVEQTDDEDSTSTSYARWQHPSLDDRNNKRAEALRGRCASRHQLASWNEQSAREFYAGPPPGHLAQSHERFKGDVLDEPCKAAQRTCVGRCTSGCLALPAGLQLQAALATVAFRANTRGD